MMMAKLNTAQRLVYDVVARARAARGVGPRLPEMLIELPATWGKDRVICALRALRSRKLVSWEHGDYSTLTVTGNPDSPGIAGADGAREALLVAGAAIERALGALDQRGT